MTDDAQIRTDDAHWTLPVKIQKNEKKIVGQILALVADERIISSM